MRFFVPYFENFFTRYAEGIIPLQLGLACCGMQMAINSRRCCQNILLHHNEVGSKVLDSMVLAHSNVGVEDMDRSKDHDRSSSLSTREEQLP